MKTKFTITTLVFMMCVFLFTECSNKTKTIKISDASDEKLVFDASKHKCGDAYVVKTWFTGDAYKVIMFHDYSGKMQKYECYYITNEKFTKARLTWKNDTTLSVTLLNPGTRNKEHLEIFGNGPRTGLHDDN